MKKILLILFSFLAALSIFAYSPALASDEAAECEPCPKHDHYECTTPPCGGIIKDIWCEKCCCSGKDCCWEAQRDDCKIWQKCDTVEGTCHCDSLCLQKQQNWPKEQIYLDNPINGTDKGNKNVALPVELQWKNDPWENLGGPGPMRREPYGTNSFVIKFDNNDEQLNYPSNPFIKVLRKLSFNSIDDAYSCFFNSSSNIKWYVKACCNKDGTDCGPYTNWNFNTLAAPEPKSPLDPDWNGPRSLGDTEATKDKRIDFCSAKMEWCKAKVREDKKPYNKDQDFSLSYQILFRSNENKELGLSDATVIVPPQYQTYANWLLTDKPAATNGLWCHYLQKQVDNTCEADAVNPIEPLVPRTWWSTKENPNQDRAFLTKDLNYSWRLRRCFENPAAQDESCSLTGTKGWGQTWKFLSKDLPLEAPRNLFPEDDADYNKPEAAKLVAMPASLSWTAPCGSNSFAYDIQKISGKAAVSLVKKERRVQASQVVFAKNAANTIQSSGENAKEEVQNFDLEVDTAYKWRVKSCWPSLPVGETVCDEEWSPWFYLRTTGRPPILATMKPENVATNLQMPVTLQWEAVPNAKSYNLFFGDQKITIKENQYALDYPAIDQNSPYSWRVQTCAFSDGQVCGQETAEFSFMTAPLGVAEKPVHPDDNGKIFTESNLLVHQFTWESVVGAHYYRFILDYVEKSGKETRADCIPKRKIDKIVDNNSTDVNKNIDQLYCLGKYRWSAQACLDKECKDAGGEPKVWSFDFDQETESPKGKMLAVCGLANDNPNTLWDEREGCTIKHIFILVQQIINFILFYLSIMLLPVMGLVTGLIFYTQFGGGELLEKVKTMWKAVGIGYAILFLSWTIVGVLLTLAGYNGLWWKL